MLVAATLKYARISPQKCRLVANVIRGKSVDDALRALTFSPKKSAGILKKILDLKLIEFILLRLEQECHGIQMINHLQRNMIMKD